MDKSSLYQTIWRWHFYAGLFVIPFVLILSVTGAIYLFKPQLDSWQDSDMRNLTSANYVSVDKQFDAMRKSYPKASFHHYKLPVNRNDAVIFHIGLVNGTMRDIYVSPQGKVIAAKNPEDRISAIISKIHGTLLLGKAGRYLIELVASWAIIMIITGLYLWWPLGKKYAGVLWPRLRAGKKIFWRDLHAVTGFYISGLVMILLLTGLPWTQLWSSGFDIVRDEMGWVNNVEQDWNNPDKSANKVHLLHAEHDHKKMMKRRPSDIVSPTIQDYDQKNIISFERLDAIARRQTFNHPIIIEPQQPINSEKIAFQKWKIFSQTQNRPLRRSVTIDNDGDIVDRQNFSDRHIIDQIISYGIAWHEGQLFGWLNQFIGLITALALIILSISGIKIWWRRRAINLMSNGNNLLQAPPKPQQNLLSKTAIIVIGLCSLLLPMMALSLLAIFLIDYFIVRKFDSN